MNLMMKKFKQEHINVYWEPFATSTPLKTVPNNFILNVERQKQGSNSSDPLNLLRKQGLNVLKNLAAPQSPVVGSKKATRSHYFDVTSSSDEDDSKENIKRPVIKINPTTPARSKLLLKNEKFEEKAALEKEVGDDKKLNKSKDVKNKSVTSPIKKRTTVNNLRIKNTGKDIKSRKGVKRRVTSPNLPKQIVENKIVSGAMVNKNLIEENEKSKIIENNLNSPTNKFKIDLQHLSTESNSNKNKNKSVNMNGVMSNKESCVQPATLNKKVEKISKLDIKQNELPEVVPLKRKGNKAQIVAPAIKVRKKSQETEKPQSVNKKDSVLHVWDKKKNLSHQLFSDSIEQELIDTLDLTAGSDDEPKKLDKISDKEKPKVLTPKLVKEKVAAKTKRNHRTCISKNERPSRNRKVPKEYWLPENMSNATNSCVCEELNKLEKSSKDHLNDETKDSKGSTDVAEKPPKGTKKIKAEKKTERDVTKESVSGQINEDKNANLNGDKKGGDSCDKENKKNQKSAGGRKIPAVNKRNTRRNGVTTKEENEKGAFGSEEEEKKEKTPSMVDQVHYPVFKELSKLSYTEESQSGCSTSECWSVKSFKCGVFTLKSKSRLSNRTTYDNSYFGGVVIKGSLKMKIGSRELKLKEGDMSFVPPLTDWEALNVGDTESIVYYWCGRFKT